MIEYYVICQQCEGNEEHVFPTEGARNRWAAQHAVTTTPKHGRWRVGQRTVSAVSEEERSPLPDPAATPSGQPD